MISNDQFLMETQIKSGYADGRRSNYRTTSPEESDWIDLTRHKFLDALRHQIELNAG